VHCIILRVVGESEDKRGDKVVKKRFVQIMKQCSSV
jgi:hypothetical protein